MRTLVIHMRITSKEGKSFLTSTRESGRSVHDCLEKATQGWDGDKVEITSWWAI